MRDALADSDSESGGSLSESAKRKRGSRAAPKRSQVDIALEHVQERLKSDDRQAAALMTAAGLVRQSSARRDAALENLNAAAGGRLGKNLAKERLYLHLLGVELDAKEEAFLNKLQNLDDQMEGEDGEEEGLTLQDVHDQLEARASPKESIEYVLIGETQEGERKGRATVCDVAGSQAPAAIKRRRSSSHHNCCLGVSLSNDLPRLKGAGGRRVNCIMHVTYEL